MRKMRTHLLQKAAHIAKKAKQNVGCRLVKKHELNDDESSCGFCDFDPTCPLGETCCDSELTVTGNICCPDPCVSPAELNISAEVDGGVFVSGIVMLYFYKARIHGGVDAPNSDIVIAERTRFDDDIVIHFYGTILACEINGDVTVKGISLWDASTCTSITLQGFFTTNFDGQFFATNVSGGPCTPFIYDAVTGNYYFINNGESFPVDEFTCSECIGCFIP